MAIKFEEKKPSDAIAPVATPARTAAKPVLLDQADDDGPAAELPFAKAVRPEKKRKSMQAKKP